MVKGSRHFNALQKYSHSEVLNLQVFWTVSTSFVHLETENFFWGEGFILKLETKEDLSGELIAQDFILGCRCQVAKNCLFIFLFVKKYIYTFKKDM